MRRACLLLCSLAFACNSSPPAPGAASPTPATSPTAATQNAPAVAAPMPTSATPAAPAASMAGVAGPGASADLVGKPAPDFTTTAQDGSVVHLAAYKGKPVVLYFYPKDETPGCTKEACSFRDAWTAIAKSGAVLVGVSADTLDSHKEFVSHYKLPFVLVSDPDGSLGQKFGVRFQGRHHRETIVIGADGTVRKVYREVDVTVHAQQILDDLSHPA